MKKQIMMIVILGSIAFTSCKKKYEISSCINGPTTLNRGQSAEYTWCGVGEEDVSWTSSYSGSTLSNGPWFTPNFPSPGKYTITATAKNKKNTVTKSIEVEYGSVAKIRCKAYNTCFTGNNAIPSTTGYKAYLYASIADWEEDLLTHNKNKVKDSTNLSYSSDVGTGYADFMVTAPIGTNYYVMVQGAEEISGAAQFSAVKRGLSSAGQYGHVVLTSYGHDETIVYVDDHSKRFFSGKWVLQSNEINSVPVTIQACNQDDYIKFYADGTWKYEVGSDNCGGTSLPSNGTYPYFTSWCSNSNPYVLLTTLSGPFTGIQTSYFESVGTFRVNYTVGSSSGIMRFTYQP